MTYTKINENIIEQLKKIIDHQDVLIDNDNLEKYGQDETEDFIFKPDLASISAVLKKN